MVVINDVTVSLGGFLVGVLNDMKEFPKHDWDVVNLVTGDEGDGKTSFVKLASYYLDQTVNEDRWAYNSQQFERIVDMELPVGSNIIWDESDELADHWASRVIQTMTRKFKRIRKKRYVIWLITPTLFDMRPYFVIKRTKSLFDVYAEPQRNKEGVFEANRGRVRFFNKDRKRMLFIHGRKEWNMKATTPNFIDRFGKVPSNYPINEELLEAKKDEAMKSLLQPEKAEVGKVPVYRAACVSRFEQWYWSNHMRKPSGNDFAYIFGISDRQAYRDLKHYAQKFGENPDFARDSSDVGDINDKITPKGFFPKKPSDLPVDGGDVIL